MKMIGAASAMCRNSKEGCKEVVKFSQINHHETRKCLFRQNKVGFCPLCLKKIETLKDKEEHTCGQTTIFCNIHKASASSDLIFGEISIAIDPNHLDLGMQAKFRMFKDLIQCKICTGLLKQGTVCVICGVPFCR